MRAQRKAAGEDSLSSPAGELADISYPDIRYGQTFGGAAAAAVPHVEGDDPTLKVSVPAVWIALCGSQLFVRAAPFNVAL